jgi:hypothetical protein
MGVVPSSQIAAVSDTMEIDIDVSSVSSLYAAGFDLDYDPVGIRIVETLEASFLSADGAVSTAFTVDNSEVMGRLLVGVTRTDYQSGGASSQAETTLVSIRIEVLTAAVHQLVLSRSSLIAPDGVTHYEHTVSNGQIDASCTDAEELAEPGGLPRHLTLSQNFPNPFNSTTTIQYSLGSPQHVTIEVFDVLGRHVVTLLRGRCSAGGHDVVWHGQDSHGVSVPSGVYFYRVTAGGQILNRKMVIMK